jgi:hypothetical protein
VNDTRHAFPLFKIQLRIEVSAAASGKAAAALLIGAMISRRLMRFPQGPTIAGQI